MIRLSVELYRRHGYHLGGSTVLVVLVQVTLSVVGIDQPSQLPVQGQVGHVVRGEHQKVEGLLPPADLLLVGVWEEQGRGIRNAAPV